MKTEELDRLIHDYLEDCLSESDAASLNLLLEQSAEARQRYWETASVHGMLEDAVQQASLRVVTGKTSPERDRMAGLTRWRSWSAAAVGLAFGILSASIVWAYALPSMMQSVGRVVPIVAEGFEKADMVPPRGFPKVANVWSGDLSVPVTAEEGVTPIEGTRMMRLMPPNTRKFSYAWRIVDLVEQPAPVAGETRRLEVAAAFNAPGPARPLRYQVRLAAFSQEPAAIRKIWNNEPVLFDTVLQHVGRNLRVGADETGWQTVRATLEIPPETRSIVISLAASEADPASAPEVYCLDDVQARLVIVHP
jgi:hypothetical protein